MRWFRRAFPQDTTSEPSVGNSRSGAPVKASMSGGILPQPGWNRGMYVHPTPEFSGVGFFYSAPNIKEVKTNGKRKPVHF